MKNLIKNCLWEVLRGGPTLQYVKRIRQIESRKNGPLKKSPRKNREVSVEHRGVCVCVWNVGMRSIYENPRIEIEPKTRKKNSGVSVEHRGVCVKCWDVINLWKPKTRQQTFLDSFSVLQFGACRIVGWTSNIFLCV